MKPTKAKPIAGGKVKDLWTAPFVWPSSHAPNDLPNIAPSGTPRGDLVDQHIDQLVSEGDAS